MKKIFTLSLSVLLCTVVFAGGTYNTSGISGVAVIERDASTFKLIYKAAKAGDVRVSILDSRNKLVFEEFIKTVEGFSRPYNFGNLKEGEYTIEIVDSDGKQIEKIHNYSNKVEKIFNVRKIQSEKKFVLMISGKGRETVTVKIYDGSDALVYNERKVISGDFAQVYNIKSLKGIATFEVTGENGESKIIQY